MDWETYRQRYIEAPGAGGEGGPPLYEVLPETHTRIILAAKVQEISGLLSESLKRVLGNIAYQGNDLSIVFLVHHMDIVVALFREFFSACGMDAMALLSCRRQRFSRNMPFALWPQWMRSWARIKRPFARTSKNGSTIIILREPGARLSIRRLQLDDCDHLQCPRCLWRDEDGPAPSICHGSF